MNDQHRAAGLRPAYELPPREVPPPIDSETTKQGPKKWRICQNFAQLNKVMEVVPMPQGDILAKQQRLSGQRYISIFDFAAGYYAIEVPEKWRPRFTLKGEVTFGTRECRWGSQERRQRSVTH